MTLLTAFKNKQLLVLGAGLTGMSCARFLASQGLCFAVNDSRENPFSADYSELQFREEFEQAILSLGCWDSDLIANADVILISPGIDSSIAEIAQFIKADCQVIGDVELFCQLNNQRNKPISLLAVTGSNGKSTVVSLVYYLAKALGVNAQLGGNIGQPVLDLFTQASDLPEFLILELSSFQLETLNSMKAIATSVLNVSDDHLDRHQSMANYQAIKQGIYRQGKFAITNRDDIATSKLDKTQPQLSFGSAEPSENEFGVRSLNGNTYLAFGDENLIALEELPLAGMHNALNYLAALALGYSAGWSLAAMVKSLAGFTGLAHRCQRIQTTDGITWINDSKATNVGATLAAIDGLAKTISAHQHLILIAGGDGKGADFTPLAKPISQHVSHLITLGKDGDKIADLLNETDKSHAVSDLLQAVKIAKEHAQVGDVVLLSPACASLDMFKNFVERGEKFTLAVKALTEVKV
ncbi:MAG: UDP-N-acetylmuramoyl-L-alanine--D-glutamate ligase [Colwellia sp.]|nr:UDP-N-acetylmuramoyl-L-alanine--D-glutamate ligase [Colwellia sp.]MCW8865975.1 UDP-N-acetylmuramoyl-L-alanine--D-glutamate ligase [Colwellia sp.]MCW9082334.1 UDP-N-acetylmuramoyl-L-alanine--D-glutamate ligase [Colwellia sp.]